MQMFSNRKKFLLIILIVVLAAFLRLYNLPAAPPGLYPDEAMNGNNALEAIQTDNYKIFYPENNGREGLFINIQAFFLKIFMNSSIHPEPWMLRITSAFFGILTVLGIYFLTKELFANSIHKSEIALLAAFFMATSFWHINFSRIGFRAIMAPFFLTWALYFLIAAFNKIINSPTRLNEAKNQNLKTIILTVFGGILYGLGFYSYIAYRATPLLILIIFLLFWFMNKNGVLRRKIVFTAFYFSLSTIFIIAPLAFYFINNPADFFGRTTQVSVFASQSPVQDLLLNIVKTLGMFNVYGDNNWRHNIAGRPLLFWPVGIMFLIGLIFSIRQLFKNEEGSAGIIIFSWLTATALPVIISNEGIPHALRAILMAPPIFILAALGIFKSKEWLIAKNFSKKCVSIGLWLIISSLIFESYHSYFNIWGKNQKVQNAFSQNYVKMGQIFALLIKRK